MNNKSKITPRHTYNNPDTRDNAMEYKVYRKKRLRGMPISVDLHSYNVVIREYMFAKYGIERKEQKGTISCVDFDLILFLARFEHTFDLDDMNRFPTDLTNSRMVAKYKRLEENGFITRFEGWNMNKRRRIQYRLGDKARRMVVEYYDLCFKLKPIPLAASVTSKEFVRKYRSAINDFNTAVEESKND